MRLPGTRLLALARLLVDRGTVERVLEPLVADWQHELAATGPSFRRAVILIHGLLAFLAASVWCLFAATTPPAIRRRTWTTLAVFVVLGMIVEGVPVLLRTDTTIGLLVWWVPSLLLLSVAFAALPVAVQLGANSGERAARRRFMLWFGLAVTAFTIVVHGWMVPYANQAFRERAAPPSIPRPIWRGARELTVTELFSKSRSAALDRVAPRELQLERHGRAVFVLVPLVLAILGWKLGSLANYASRARVTFWWMFVGATSIVLQAVGESLARRWLLPREVALWFPLVVWSAAIVALERSGANAAGGSEDPPLHVPGTTR